MIAEGLEIPEASEFSKNVKALAQSVLDAGPLEWTEKDLQRARYMITDYCDDMKTPRSPEELTATATQLYSALADFYFRAQKLWSAKGKSIPRRLENTDPEYAQKFSASFKKLFERCDPSSVFTLAEETLKPYGGFLFENARADAPVAWRKPIS